MPETPERFERDQFGQDIGHGLSERQSAGVDDRTLTAVNVSRGLELGVFDGCAQWALGQ